jgi:hypothetical protein
LHIERKRTTKNFDFGREKGTLLLYLNLMNHSGQGTLIQIKKIEMLESWKRCGHVGSE